MDWNNINRDRDTSGLGPIEYDQSKVPALIRKHADYVRTKTYGQEVREAQARNAEVAGLIASEAVDTSNETKERQSRIETQFNSVQQELTDKDVISAPEIIAARKGMETLGDRLDEIDEVIEEDVIKMELFKKRPTDIDDSERFQRAINYAHSVNKPLVLNGGVHYVKMINVPTGFTLIGNGAILKKPNLSAPPYNMTPSQMKWMRLAEVKDYSGDTDSAITQISGLTFDGSCWDMWDTPSYEQEQASLFLVSADATKKGRVKIKFDNCHFINNVSDGIHIWTNVDAQINNCSSYDCFRGGLVITGGHSKVSVNNFTASSNRLNDGVDVEVDSKGYGGSYAIELNMSNIFVDTDFDVNVPNNSTANLSNIILSKEKGSYALGVGFNSILNVNNSQFVSPASTTAFNRLLLSGVANFTNCNFLASKPASVASLLIYSYGTNNVLGKIGKSWKANFTDCKFSYIGEETESTIVGLKITASGVSQIKLVGCEFDDTLSTAIDAQLNRLEVKDSYIDSKVRGVYWTSNSYNPEATLIIDNLSVLNNSVVYLYNNLGTGTKNNIIHKNMILDIAKNNFGGNASGLASILENQTYYTTWLGSRTVYVDHDPNTSPYVRGTLGDIAISKTPIANGMTEKWECVRMQSASSPYNSVWKKINPQ